MRCFIPCALMYTKDRVIFWSGFTWHAMAFKAHFLQTPIFMAYTYKKKLYTFLLNAVKLKWMHPFS